MAEARAGASTGADSRPSSPGASAAASGRNLPSPRSAATAGGHARSGSPRPHSPAISRSLGGAEQNRSYKDINVMVVDDLKFFRKGLVARLHRVFGIPLENIIQARNFDEAVDLLGTKNIDLVTMDFDLPIRNTKEDVLPTKRPSTNGAQTIARMRELGYTGYIFVATSHAKGSTEEESMRIANGEIYTDRYTYIGKPSTIPFFKHALNNVLDIKEGSYRLAAVAGADSGAISPTRAVRASPADVHIGNNSSQNRRMSFA